MIKFLVSLLLLLPLSSINAQIDGYTINRNGDTTSVTFKKNQYITGHFNPLAFQENPKYLIGKKKKSIDLMEVEELGFELEGETYIYKVIPRGQGLVIRRQLLKGSVVVYSELSPAMVHNYGDITMGGGLDTKYLIRQNNGIPFTPKAIGFKKNLLRNLDPCPAFEQILDSQTFGLRDILFLMESYNKDCH